MKRNDYSSIATFAELRKARNENALQLSSIAQRINLDVSTIGDSLMNVKMVLTLCEKTFSLFSGISFISRIALLMRKIFAK